MAHVEPRSMDDLEALRPVMAGAEAAMGFVPNSMLTMAHMPQLPAAFSMLTGVVFGGDLAAILERLGPTVTPQSDAEENLSPATVQLIAYASSVSAGCRYCQAHTSHNAHRFGVSTDQLNDLLNYAHSANFSDSERAVIALALAAGAVPNESDSAHFRDLRAHYSERQIVQIVAVISMFGFLNRWNDTMATHLEDKPVAFASTQLRDWEAGKHE